MMQFILETIWERGRMREWSIHVIIYLVCGALYATTFDRVPGGFWTTYFQILVLQGFLYPAAYLCNDYCDREEDTRKTGGRRRPHATWLLTASILLFAISFAWLLYTYDPGTLAAGTFLGIVAIAYSAEPIRCKERGFAGVLVAAFSQRLPFFWILASRHDVRVLPACSLSVYLAFTGLLFILHHQWEDVEVDRLTGTRTWAVREGRVLPYRTCVLSYVMLAAAAVGVWITRAVFGDREGATGLFALGYSLVVVLTIAGFVWRYGYRNRLRVLAHASSPAIVSRAIPNERVFIRGAGLAGMVAAIKLAESGLQVEVHTPSPSLGGLESAWAGVHVTHADLTPLWEYLGIDLSHAFTPIRQERGYVYGRRYDRRTSTANACRRGHEPGCLDQILYEIACRHKVCFRFSSREGLAPDGRSFSPILAAGLNTDTYVREGIPYRNVDGYHAAASSSPEAEFAYFKDARLGKDFGYVASAGSRRYALLFSRDGLPTDSLEHFASLLSEKAGIEFHEWKYFNAAIPLGCSLFHNGNILAGTMSGMIDPFYLGGIPGALVSGKIAALAVFARERASAEFEWFTRNRGIANSLSSLARKYFDRPLLYAIAAAGNAAIKPLGTL